MTKTRRVYNTAEIRKLVTEAFTAQDLHRFCQDRPLFRNLIKQFGPKQGLTDMADEVIGYCGARRLFDELLGEIERCNPVQYDRFGPYVYDAVTLKALPWRQRLFITYQRTPLASLPILKILIGSVAVLVLAVSSLFYYRQLSRPRPRLSGPFNIAVAEFGCSSESGKVRRCEEGEWLSTMVAQRLDAEYEQWDAEFRPQVWDTGQFGRLDFVKGATHEARAAAAAEVARATNADLVIYGDVTLDEDGGASLVPEFYIRELIYHPELVGVLRLGSVVAFDRALRVADRSIVNQELAGRTNALVWIASGVSYLSIEQPERAYELFDRVQDEVAWPDVPGKEILYILLGASLYDQNRLDEAQVWYDRAISVNPLYARSYVAAGAGLYRQAIGDPQQAGIDRALMEKAIGRFEEALRAPEKPPEADVEVKVWFMLGQARLLIGQDQLRAGEDAAAVESLQAAEADLKATVDAYQAGDKAVQARIVEMAASANSHLGLMAFLSHDDESALARFKAALTILEEQGDRPEKAAEIRLYCRSLLPDAPECQDVEEEEGR